MAIIDIIGLIWMGFGCALGIKGYGSDMCLLFMVGLLFLIYGEVAKFRKMIGSGIQIMVPPEEEENKDGENKNGISYS